MKDPEDGDLLIVGDRQQGIYGAKSIVWSSVGIKAVGRTIHAAFDLDKNYRNSREILELAAAFAQDQEQLSDDQFGVVPVDSAKSLRATGIRPLLLRGNSRRHECRRIVSVEATLLQAGGRSDPRFPEALRPGQMGILYPWMPHPESPLLDELLKHLETLAPVVWLRDRDRHRVGEPAIKVQSIHSSKGLQYRAVILLWADRLPRTFPDSDPEEERKLMYVALTRAENYLFISYSEASAFIDRVGESGKVLVS
jgi:superfamily I DNA/RNA helicase